MKTYELKVLMVREEDTNETGIASPAAAAAYWRKHIETNPWFQSDKEHLVVLLLNARSEISGYNLVSIGTINGTQAHAREVFRAAVAGAAVSIVIMHNHPSGNTDPSDADINITQKMVRAGRVLDIKVADHIIVGGATAYYSLLEHGLMTRE